MSTRSKRAASSARPGKIITDAKQKRRSADEMAADDLEKEQVKAAKENSAMEAHEAGVQRAANMEVVLRAEDKLARKNSARPDLGVTAELDDIVVESDHENRLDSSMDEDNIYDPLGEDPSDDDNNGSDDEEAIQQFLKSRALQKKKAKKPAKAAKDAIRTEVNNTAGIQVDNKSNNLKRKPIGQTTEIE
ncbi:hypothetical protein B0H12DRAFT_1244880 [Mycena haematopus]|nr:hypothetical protein B0H12DRAFT_1244880 [Mycena haematopus]